MKAIGQALDMIEAGPETQLTAIIDTWGAHYIKRVQAVMDGTWETQSTWDGLKDGILDMAPYTSVPDDVKGMAESEVSDDGTLLGMNFYVQGVDDQLPQ